MLPHALFRRYLGFPRGRAIRALCMRCAAARQRGGSRTAFRTETTSMKSIFNLGVAVVLVGTWSLVSGLPAGAGEWLPGCRSCGPCGTGAGQATPYGDTGCGPRYHGAVHDDPCGVDPCDSCNRWAGCNGARQMTDMLAPWQLPPGCGFRTAAEVGYDGSGGGGICTDCSKPWYRLW